MGSAGRRHLLHPSHPTRPDPGSPSRPQFARDDRGAVTAIDFLLGITVFLFAFLGVVSLLPSLFTPFESQGVLASQVADRVSVFLAESYLVDDPAFPNIASRARLEGFIRDEMNTTTANYAATLDRLGLNTTAARYDLNVTLTYPNSTSLAGGPAAPSTASVGQTARLVAYQKSGYGAIAGSALTNSVCAEASDGDPEIYVNRSTSGLDEEGDPITPLPPGEDVEITITNFNVTPGNNTSYNPLGLTINNLTNSSDEVWLNDINVTGSTIVGPVYPGDNLRVVFRASNVTRKFPNNETTYGVELEFDNKNGVACDEAIDLRSYVQPVREAARLDIQAW